MNANKENSMKETKRPFTLQHPTALDLERVFQFMNACDIAEYGEADSDPDELADQWQEVDLAEEVWITLDPEGALNGYAMLTAEGERGRFFDLYTHRTGAPQGLEEALIEAALRRFNHLIETGQSAADCKVTAFVSGVNTKNRAAMEAKGFRVKTYHYRMQLDFEGPLTAPTWPAEFELKPFEPGQEKELYELIASTFDWQGAALPSFEAWQDTIFRGGRYDPELFIMVRLGGQLVGAALCYPEEPRGWIREIAVAKSMQGKGLGSRLLKHVFGLFAKKGLSGAALGVASANESAYHFYERCGMIRSREFVQYQYGAEKKSE
jgi:ribosomal protein S18 acetylase RimI-like enzyme